MVKLRQRDSNIELLRIVSMFIIVIYHFISHSIISNSQQYNFVLQPLISILHIGVICFVLISGYWGIKFSLKGFVKLFLYCSLYSILIYIVNVLVNPDVFNLMSLFKAFIPNQWWFIPVYLSLYLLVPIINLPLNTASREKKLVYIIILLIISYGFGMFVPALSNGKNPINFVMIYYIGNFLRTGLKLPSWLTASKILLIYLSISSLLFLVFFLLSKNFSYLKHYVFELFFPYNSIGLILNSIIFFLIFAKISFSSKLVNWLASSTLAVYLIHENSFIGGYLYGFALKMQNELDNLFMISLSIIVFGVIVFIGSVLIDKLFSPGFNLFFNFIFNSKLFKKMNQKLEVILQ